MGREQINQETIEIDDETADLGDFKLKSGNKITVSLKIIKGKLHAQLFDHTGEKILSNVKYACIGPYGTKLEGTTDSTGVLKHDNVPLGDYETKIDDKYTTNIPAVQSDSEMHHQIVEEHNENAVSEDDEKIEEPEMEEEENATFDRNMSYEDFLNPPK